MKKILVIILVVIVIIVVGGLGYATNYLFNYAIVPGEKDFLAKQDNIQQEKEWKFAQKKLTDVTLKSHDGLTLSGTWVNQEKTTKKIAIVAHGYMQNASTMGQYAELFYRLGYDVLVPDNRAHGKSEGEYVGFGWLDRLDYLQWIDEVIQTKGKDCEIVLFGVSMGAATVMMTSGEKLPSQVKAIVEDCGYDSVTNELAHQLKEMFHIPAFPLIPLTSLYTQIRAGYSFNQASAVKQLANNHLPTLFIHGDKDKFVPTSMVYKLYDATKGPKELIIFEGSGHAKSLADHPKEYEKVISNFLKDYLN
ncbi:alpha/beta hydrolase [Vagococcus penaei]|uniref:Alpha/beta hydrolase n=1 Tax=Vagococcus penaei TaxID=633807 RepID=A0A1Q2D814_9ENTE|nr:alpha/beta hydrolase [Vagococcus penaei]AQP54519.1 alpha/beta hydrolase [Vagococcus penaei]RSU06773.1 alpha/beta hydrolase [Vagococcus penaei]